MDEHGRENIQKYLNEEIYGCYNCQPWDSGEPVWIEPKSDLYDLLQYFEVEDKDMEEALRGFCCPRCGTDLEEPYLEVAVKTEYDHKIAKIFKELDHDSIKKKLAEFSNFITNFPYLGILHPVGQEIFNCVAKVPSYNAIEEKWFRARLFNEESRIFSPKEMSAPSPTIVYIKEGRYNHAGQSFLYLGSDPKTSFFEIKNSKENACVIQEFMVHNVENILDLRIDYNNIPIDVDIIYLALIYSGHLNRISDSKSSWKPEYFIPRFVADVSRKHGYNGIIYNSAVSFGCNLTIFDGQSTKASVKGEPYLYEQQKSPLEIIKNKKSDN